ncbi:serine O-acetyltransferase EpsC [Lentzea sp. HUAS TT2]|uniref:serine O-acetyltransferase EpsC n=1 Tax=Lentzea sp. HUAS TT2 TaxID=3447454 RepID=UPI003F6F993E
MNARALLHVITADLDMVLDRDPSIASRSEALLHPTVIAIWGHRVSHWLHLRGHRRSARFVMVIARLLTGGIEIHPGAKIGRGFFIDHGAGVVIGETVIIGDDVTIFHQVTLGAVGWWHDNQRPEGSRRHPKLGDRVVVGANATILGPVTIGHDSVVGAQALVIRDVPADSRVLAPFSVPALKSTRGVVKAARARHPIPAPRHKGAQAVFPTW